MSPYQVMVKKIISSLESLEVVEDVFSAVGVELNDGSLRECIRDVEDIVYDLDEMLGLNEDCNDLFSEVAEAWEDVSISDSDYPKAIQELEFAVYDLQELENKAACLILSNYLDRYKNIINDVVESVFALYECIYNLDED